MPPLQTGEEPTINREFDNELSPQLDDKQKTHSLERDEKVEGAEPTLNVKREEPKQTLDAPAEGTELKSGEQTADGQVTGEVESKPSEFKPDYKFKVRDQEIEMDDWVKDLVKDEETFKKVQDLYTRGHGLEIAKQERDEFKSKFSDLEQSVNHVAGIANEYYKDPANPQHAAKVARQFIEALGLPKQMFLQYAIDEVNYQNLPPEQKRYIDNQRQTEMTLAQLQQQNQQLQSQTGNLQSQHYEQLLGYKMADPTIAPIVQEYETRVGRPGAFREMVVQRGIYRERLDGTVITPDQAVNEVIQLLGITPGGTQTQTGGQMGTSQNQPQQQQVQQPLQQQQKPVLPNVSGQGTASPVKKTYSTLDQIRKRRDELLAQQG